MFRIESYVTPILLSYVDKYVRDFKPKDAQVSLWGGGVALHNLVIKAEVLQQELSLPLTLISGRIHELLIQVPWTKIMSEPIVVTIDTIECILGLNPPPEPAPVVETPDASANPQVEAPPGYMQALVRKIVSNISLKVHHLIVKLVQDDIVLSLNIKHLSVSSAGTNWEPAFADIDQNAPVIRRLVRLDDLTLCLDRSDADGRIRFYLEPLLYRCQLDFRVLTRLVSVNVRRASSIALEISSTRLAWAICNEQLLLLLRLSQDIAARKLREAPAKPAAQPVTTPREPDPTAASSVTGEPVRTGSWSEWAWSWLPAWEPDESSPSPVVSGPSPLPISVSVRLDEILLMYKILESDSSASRRRARSILELHLNHLIARLNLVQPTCLNIRMGLRDMTLLSHGKCVCSHLNTNAAMDEPTKYLFRGGDPVDASWKWPEDDFIEELCVTPPKSQKRLDHLLKGEPSMLKQNPIFLAKKASFINKMSTSKISALSLQSKHHTTDENPNPEIKKEEDPSEKFWNAVNPLIFIELGHYKTPPSSEINPYDNPPADFEYSDWAEDSSIHINVKPLNLHLRTDFFHRLQTIQDVMSRLEPVSAPVKPRRVLTVEENDSLLHNLPQRRITVQLNDFAISLFPWDHMVTERPNLKQLTLELHIPHLSLQMTSPLYPHRVCSAASQLPVCSGSLYQASRLQTTLSLRGLQFYLTSENGIKKYVGKTSIKLVAKQLLNKDFFQTASEEIVHTNISLKIYEFNVCSCAARLFVVTYLLQSITNEEPMPILWNSSVSKDAIYDEKHVALDFTLEEMTLRAYCTKNVNTVMSTIKSVKATLIQEHNDKETQQAWLFSGPDTPSNNPYFRLALQWCTSPTPVTLEYLGLWSEPSAICIDPLFAVFLAYRPVQRVTPESYAFNSLGLNTKRRFTPPSSSGRGASKTGSGPELVHTRTRSSDSSPTPTEQQQSQEKKINVISEEHRLWSIVKEILESSGEEQHSRCIAGNKQPIYIPRKKTNKWYRGERVIDLHKRVQSATFLIEFGMTMVYVTVSTATAVNTVTVRDAMEMHATTSNLVTAFGLGILTMGSNPESQALWKDIRNDAPTILHNKMNSFPWRVTLSDLTCYTLEAQPKLDSMGRDKAAHGLRSKLKVPLIVTPNIILDLVSTTVTITVVTKKAKIAKSNVKKDGDKKGKKHGKQKDDDEGDKEIKKQIEYFTSGIDFSPSTLQEFLRGPTDRRRKTQVEESDDPMSAITFISGPILSFGINVHADTPPIVLRLDYDQVMMLSTSLHCLQHVVKMINDAVQLLGQQSFRVQKGTQTSQARSVSDILEDESTSDDSEQDDKKQPSDLISIFESAPQMSSKTMKKFFWLQWVISRATVVINTANIKLMIDIDDIMATVDKQRIYNQYKLKLTSLSVRHQEKVGDEWKAGVLNGRILEVREPTTVKEDSYFLSVTVTQAWITNIPDSWKDVLHPRILNKKSIGGSIWEIYATVAPLEVMLRPSTMEVLMVLIKEMSMRSSCPIGVLPEPETSTPKKIMELPLCYLSAGGIRIIVTEDSTTEAAENMQKSQKIPDDTFIFQIGKITINPHPDNPIIRRAVSTHMESTWSPTNIGAQYELMVKGICIRSTVFHQIMMQEARDAKILKAGTAAVNPALQWTQPTFQPMYTTVLHSVNVSCVLAPANYNRDGLLTHGTAIEFNIVTDCNIEVSMRQLILAKDLVTDTVKAVDTTGDSCYSLMLDYDKQERLDRCPYADPLKLQESVLRTSRLHNELIDRVTAEEPYTNIPETELNKTQEFNVYPTLVVDSGVQTTYTRSSITHKSSKSELKKPASVVFLQSHKNRQDATQYLEVFVTTGTIELSFYCDDEMTLGYSVLKIPKEYPAQESKKNETPKEAEEPSDEEINISQENRRRSLTELDREMPGAVPQGRMMIQHAKRYAGNIPLLNLALHQPNLYYWKRKSQKTLQASLFDAWVGLGAGKGEGYWHKGLLSTARGPLDQHTGVAPSLATIRLKDSSTGVTNNSRAALTIDIERPILFEICTDRMKRLNNIVKLFKAELMTETDFISSSSSEEGEKTHPLLNIRQLLVSNNIVSVTLKTTQVSLGGYYGSIGIDECSLQLTSGARPDTLHAKGLVTALFVAAGSGSMENKANQNTRNFVLQPMTFGTEVKATWDTWRKTDGVYPTDPTIHVCIEMDYMTLDIRPEDLDLVARIRKSIDDVSGKNLEPTGSISEKSRHYQQKRPHNYINTDYAEHYFKDDLRSGAFKLVRGSRSVIPAPYQIAVVDECVTWRYPQPRAIANITAHPLPMEDQEIECVLEVYMPLIGTWEAHTHFKIPVGDIAEYSCTKYNTEAIFSTTWRYRIVTDSKGDSLKFYQFDVAKYLPKSELETTSQTEVSEPESDPSPQAATCKLVGSVSIDSYFAPQSVPKLNISLRCAGAHIYVYNDLPQINNKLASFTGYYLTKPMCRNHRTFAITFKNTIIHASPKAQILLNTNIASDIFDCTTGLMVPFVNEFCVQAAVIPLQKNTLGPKLRGRCSHIRIALHIQKIDTLKMLAQDWKNAVEQHFQGGGMLINPSAQLDENDRAVAGTIASLLRGRISLWIYNSSAIAIKIGQLDSDEVFTLEPGARFAYRWYNPDIPKRLRFALDTMSKENVLSWSAGIPFAVGKYRVPLPDNSGAMGIAPQLHIKVHGYGSKLYMTLFGRLTLANIMRIPFQYKVRQRNMDGKWSTIIMGEIPPESVGQSVLCSSEAEMLLKIKFKSTPNTAWSGDIPLHECPKENVPWLVKVPNEGDLPYLSVWCRVSRGRMDGRLLAAIWPLYVLKSNLPLDADVTIYTELGNAGTQEPPLKPVVQGALGRGLVSHLHPVGTTAARHNLTFQYRLIDSPVTAVAVPLHYGVTDVSVFTKQAPTQYVDDVIDDIYNWLTAAGRGAKSEWPYSLVKKHWPYQIQPAVIQACSDVTVHYSPVRAGGGCSLEISLCPLVLLCNGSSIGLTLRAHDASPLCKLEPGIALSPPSVILTKPFYISVERGKDTYVSTELSVYGSEPGEYEKPPDGCVALNKPANFAILCNNKLSPFSLYYEIVDGMNILGISSTYVFVNRLDEDIKITGLAVPEDMSSSIVLKPKKYKTISPTTNSRNVQGTALSSLFVYGRLIGAESSKLRSFICLALEGAHLNDEEYTPLAIRLGSPPRKPAYLLDKMGESVPIVVTQVHHEGRVIISVSYDPCPQFVFHNRSTLTLAVAEAVSVSNNECTACPELSGATWHCVAPPSGTVHYSTPAHAARYPPPTTPPPTTPPTSPYTQLTFAILNNSIQNVEKWSAPVFVTEGEQLLKLNDCTLKLRVTSHPHSTLLEVREVGTDDISASDIRKRLMQSRMYDKSGENFRPHRTGANDQLPVLKDGVWSASHLATSSLNENETQTTSVIPQQNITQYNVSENSYLHFLDKKSGRWRKRRDPNEQIDAQPSPEPQTMTPGPLQIHEEVPQDTDEVRPMTIEGYNPAPQDVVSALKNIFRMTTPNPELALNPVRGTELEQAPNLPASFNAESTQNLIQTPNLQNVVPGLSSVLAPNTQPALNLEPAPNLEQTPNLQSPQNLEPQTNPRTVPNPQLALNPNLSVSPEVTQTEGIRPETNEGYNSAPQMVITALKNIFIQASPNLESYPSAALNLEAVPHSVPTSTQPTLKLDPALNLKPASNLDLLRDNITTDTVSKNTNMVTIKVGEPITRDSINISNPIFDKMTNVSTTLQNVVTSVTKATEELYPPISENQLAIITDNPMNILGELNPTTNIMHPTGDFFLDLNILKNSDLQVESKSEMKLAVGEKSRRGSAKGVHDDTNSITCDFSATEWRDTVFGWRDLERVRFVISGLVLELASDEATPPLIAAYVDRAHILLANDNQRIRGTFTVSDIQVDNLQHNTGQFDFPVIASTRIVPLQEDKWPPICSFFHETYAFSSRQEEARLLLKTCFDKWTVVNKDFCEISELDARLGPLSLCIEDAFVTAAATLLNAAASRSKSESVPAAAETRALATPLRLRSLNVQPLDLTLTLHTAVRMYIALDHSPLRLSAFQVRDMMTSMERLTHALTVHYLSAAILGAGWMVGGLELLGAPGALAARVGGATGGVRGVASAAAAALLRSLSAWASSIARNLDILAGDEEHARRAAAARRQPPETFIAGVTAGLANLLVNMLGAVGGLAHHPLVGVATGETDSGVEALRRSLLGAVTKPLSATADLLAYAGHGLLAQTGWDPEPQPRCVGRVIYPLQRSLCWRRDSSRWRFTADLALVSGADVLLDHKPVRLLISTHHMVIVDPQSDKIVEKVNLSNCTIAPYSGAIIELRISPKRQKTCPAVTNAEDEEQVQVSQAAMARVARYTGAATPGGGGVSTECRPLAILPPTGQSLALYALLVTAIHHSQSCYCNTL